LTDDDKACLQEMMEADKLSLVQPQGSISYTALQHGSMWRELFTPVILLYTLAYFCLTNTLSALSVWTPLILQSFNQSSSNITIGFLSAVPQICTIIGMIWWSKRSDRKQERKVHTLLPYLFAAVGGMFTALGTHSLLQLLGINYGLHRAFAAMVIFWTTPDQSISLRARAIGIAGDQCHRHERCSAGPPADGLAEGCYREL
uniref:Major facilitator superfamily (MFS) profile domain-containing protein n=1 Tax=Anopheles coluzzii TaxID=1518534 RepID=A0A8W7PD10_ANOCL